MTDPTQPDARAESTALRLREVEAALVELVRLKGLKDEIDKWHPERLDDEYDAMLTEYRRCKPLAWDAARRLTEGKP